MTSQDSKIQTCKLSDIATIEKIMLHEIKAEDLLVTNKFYGAWSNYYSENVCTTYLAGLLNNSPHFLDNIQPDDTRKKDTLARQHLDIFGEEPKDEAKITEHTLNGEYNLPENDTLPPGRNFLLREEWVVRLKEEWRERLLPEYVQKQVEVNLPGLLDKLRPDYRILNLAELHACPIEVVPLEKQINSGDQRFSPIDALDTFLRPLHQGLDDILELLTPESIRVNELLNRCRTVASLPAHFERPPWVFAQELCRCLESLTTAKEGLNKNPDNKAARQIIAAYENLEQFLIKNGPWGERENPPTLFARIVVARLRLALPNTSATIAAAEKQREAEIKAEERSRITRSIFHHLKNLVAAAVIDPLELIRRQGLDKKGIIDKALRGANLLREIINAMNLASSGKPEDFLADLQEPDERAFTLGVIVETSLRAAFANMFDAKYFNKYHFVYFPKSEPERLREAKEKFGNIQTGDFTQLLDFGRDFLIKDIHWSGPKSIMDIKIGNSHNSALKLIVLFQELFMNAVKYVTQSDTRRLEIILQSGPKGVEVTISNSYNLDPWKQPGDTLIGKSIIDDFMNQLGFFTLSGNEQPGLRHFIIPLPK